MSPRKERVTERSEELFSRSRSIFPGGVNSPVRSFKSVESTPFVVEKGQGPWIFDVDKNHYVDYVMSWGPLILGHAHPSVVEAVREKTGGGTSFGAPTDGELELGLLVGERMPWIEKLRLVSSGTEACMTAARIARGATGRSLIVKFDGGYHGHSDGFLVKAGSGLATGNIPASAGVPEEITRGTLSLPYNNSREVVSAFEKNGSRIAAVFVEPVAANMGVIPPLDGFLETLRDVTSRYGTLLVFDEVITGFRVARGGAAELFDVRPDLVCLGKILGGGLPIGAVGGHANLMDVLAPLGSVYQAGTLSGNPLSTAAGIATLKELAGREVYDSIRLYAEDLTGEIARLFGRYGRSFQINRVESLFTLFFSEEPVNDFDSAGKADMTMYRKLFRSLVRNGVFLPPSGYEAWFVSTVHGKEQLDLTLRSIEKFLQETE